jgi:hypothetical protein
MNDALEKYNFLKKIVRKNDIVLEIPEFIKNDSRININALNETIVFLGNKLLTKENVKSSDEFQNIVNDINNTVDNPKIKLVTIEAKDDDSSEDYPANSSQRKLENYYMIPVFSISYY